ncbi:sialoadhesin isoform X1 [Lates calcarifer]|uniref:Sialoadhesin isoform X1 n=2 Tax=Lates calcarifer TaxID=8187 RepID=A0AAJ7V6J6_LATCA|nr:sialoadhesin isoform X1 [Lates calcarifer]
MDVGLTLVSLFIAVMQGVFCKTWDVTLPQRIVGISHSCITVPCHFEVPNEHEAGVLQCTDSGVWRKGNMTGPFINSLNSQSPLNNVVQVHVVGNLTQKNCTTVFYNFPKDYNNIYFFRLQCPNEVKYNFAKGVSITVQTAPSAPLLTSVNQISEGAQVRLQCSVPVPCSVLPPSLTWLPQDSSRQEETEMLQNVDGQRIMMSAVTFTASADHHNQSIVCSVSYPLFEGGSTESSAATQRLNVLYAPRFTTATLSTSGPVSEGRTVTFTCSSDANPPVSHYTWYRDDSGNLSSSQLTRIRQAATLVLQVSQTDSGVYLCEAQTSRGSQRSRPVSLDVKGSCEDLVLAPYVICGVLLVLYILTVVVDLYKYRSLSRRLKQIELKGENTYTDLKTLSATSDYDQLQRQQP